MPRRAPQEVLRQVMVRPIVPAERVRWDALMLAHHYLGLQVLVGHSLRYVAVVGDALLGWQAGRGIEMHGHATSGSAGPRAAVSAAASHRQ